MILRCPKGCGGFAFEESIMRLPLDSMGDVLGL
jgi:hypothetical protein